MYNNLSLISDSLLIGFKKNNYINFINQLKIIIVQPFFALFVEIAPRCCSELWYIGKDDICRDWLCILSVVVSCLQLHVKDPFPSDQTKVEGIQCYPNGIYTGLLSVGRYPAIFWKSPMNAMCWLESTISHGKVIIHPAEPGVLVLKDKLKWWAE